MRSISDLVLAVHASLADADLAHAIGGAMALAFAVDSPRGTADVDVNVFVSTAEAERVLAALPAETVWDDLDLRRLRRDGQVRVFCDGYPIDLFLSTNEFHDRAAEHVRVVTYEGVQLPILAADDLAVFKIFFNRTKDWADVEAMLEAGSLDTDALSATITTLLGRDDVRTQRLRQLLEGES